MFSTQNVTHNNSINLQLDDTPATPLDMKDAIDHQQNIQELVQKKGTLIQKEIFSCLSIACLLPPISDASDSIKEKSSATKVDHAPVPIHLWNNRA